MLRAFFIHLPKALLPPFKNNREILTICNKSDRLFPSGMLFELNLTEVPNK
jgi:hypothetical protein